MITTIKAHVDTKEHEVHVGAVSLVRANLFERWSSNNVKTDGHVTGYKKGYRNFGHTYSHAP